LEQKFKKLVDSLASERRKIKKKLAGNVFAFIIPYCGFGIGL